MVLPNIHNALDEKFSHLYDDLRRIARSRIARHTQPHNVQTTALVNDCYVKLKALNTFSTDNNLEFLSYASRTMRSIILDIAREEMAQCRGGDITVVTLDTMLSDSIEGAQQGVSQVDEALRKLAVVDPRLAEMVELRYFGGLTIEEIADARGVNERTVRRDWEKAKLLLHAMLTE